MRAFALAAGFAALVGCTVSGEGLQAQPDPDQGSGGRSDSPAGPEEDEDGLSGEGGRGGAPPTGMKTGGIAGQSAGGSGGDRQRPSMDAGVPPSSTGGLSGSAGAGGGPPAGGGAGFGGSGGMGNEPRPDAAAMPTRMDARPSQPNPCEEARGELLACFTFDDTTDDDSDAPWTAIAPQASYNEGREGRALRAGAGRAVRVNAGRELELRTFTAEALVRLDRLPAPGARMGILDSETRFGLFVLPGGDLRCSAGGTEVVARAAITAGNWHRVGCRLAPAALALVVDGRVLQMAEARGNPGPTSLTSFTIGGNDPAGDELEGLIDTTRIFRVAR